MFQNNFKTARRIIATLLLIVVITSFITALAVLIKSEKVDDNPAVVTATVETTVNEIATTAEETVMPLINIPILFPELSYIEWYDIDKCNSHISSVRAGIEKIEVALSSDEYAKEARQFMQQECTRLYSIITHTDADMRNYAEWEQDYSYAAKTWLFFRQRGYSEVVTSAIIGNMMIETAGGTLNLKPKIYSPGGSFYGLCQWSLQYRPFVADKSFEWQLEYLAEDMPKEFEIFGYCYSKNFTYDDFLSMNDPEQAAMAFAKVYERCGSGSYGLRQQAARTAYNYFVLGEK